MSDNIILRETINEKVNRQKCPFKIENPTENFTQISRIHIKTS